MADKELGRVGLVLKGEWTGTEHYVPLDLVSHDGSAWAAKRNNTNVEPTTENDDDWQLISNDATLVATVQGLKEDAEDARDRAEAAASEAEQVIAGAVRFDEAQALSDAEKIQANKNIMSVFAGYYGSGDGLTDTQKQAVRFNIGLPIIDWDAEYTGTQITNALQNFGLIKIAQKYDPSTGYSAGDVRAFNGDAYVCKETIASPAGAFDYTKWDYIPPVPMAVSYAANQGLTSQQKSQARNNIDAVSVTVSGNGLVFTY